MDPKAYAENNKPEAGSPIGVYKHPNTTEEIHAGSFPAADAFVRQGWVYDRPLPTPEEARKVAAVKAAASDKKEKETK